MTKTVVTPRKENFVRRLSIALVTVLAVALGSVALPGAAHASHSVGFIDGFGDPKDDWGDEGELWSGNHHRTSYATGLWQIVLFADGYLPWSGVDCDFGPNTTEATRNWQRDHGVGIDGRVGPQTFGRADDKLVDVGDGLVHYVGWSRVYRFARGTNGLYVAFDGFDDPLYTFYHSHYSCDDL